LTPPTSQNSTLSVEFSSKMISTCVSEMSRLLAVTPARARRTGLTRPRPEPASSMTEIPAAAAPPNDNRIVGAPDSDGTTVTARTTTRTAPALTPMISGAASGLAATACISAPATARAAPTQNASTTLGSRIDWRISSSGSSALKIAPGSLDNEIC
jgi:hypothetical protein